MKRPASLIAALFLLAVAAGHLLRIIYGVHVVANGTDIPVWVSIPAVIGPLLLALWLLRERKSGVTS